MGPGTAHSAAPPAQLIVGTASSTAAAAVDPAGAPSAMMAVIVKVDGEIEPVSFVFPFIDPIDDLLVIGVASHDVPWAHARWKPTQWSLASGAA